MLSDSFFDFSQKNLVICMGEILLDLLASERDTSWEKVKHWEELTGGAPANVAFGLARMGMNVSFLGSVGNDKNGFSLSKEMEMAGIAISLVQYNSNYPTRKVYVERSSDGERTFAGFGNVQAEDFADAHLDSNLLSDGLFSSARALVTGTLLLAFPESKKAILKVIDICLHLKMTLVLDINRRDVFWKDPEDYADQVRLILPFMHILKFSKEEAIWLIDSIDPNEISTKLPNAEVILISDGQNGSVWKIGNFIGNTKAYQVNTIDTTGAGDSFLAGFLFQYLERIGKPSNIVEATTIMNFAAGMGALTTTKPGAVNSIPSEEEVLQFINSMNA